MHVCSVHMTLCSVRCAQVQVRACAVGDVTTEGPEVNHERYHAGWIPPWNVGEIGWVKGMGWGEYG